MFLPCSKNWHTFRFLFKYIQQNGVKFSDTLLAGLDFCQLQRLDCDDKGQVQPDRFPRHKK